jgi:hypothetical protein
MSISVDEIVIQMQVSNGVSNNAAQTPSAAPPLDRDALVRECTRQVLLALNQLKGR